jgi:sporulation protein YlmC with PRC-barrel domain
LFGNVDEGLPIAYQLLEKGVPVLCSDGTQVGTVHHVVAAPEQDIFHGLVISTPGHGMRFVEGADIASLHEHGVDLRIDAAAASILPQPGGAAPSYSEDPLATKWSHWTGRLTGKGDWHRDR